MATHNSQSLFGELKAGSPGFLTPEVSAGVWTIHSGSEFPGSFQKTPARVGRKSNSLFFLHLRQESLSNWLNRF